MKTRINILATLIFLVASIAAYSTEPPVRNVQVLPAEEGILKVLYYNPAVKKATVKIFNENGLVFQDQVRIDRNEDGFLKRYEIRDCKSQVFWVEIGDKDMSYRFKVRQDHNGKMYATYWDQSS